MSTPWDFPALEADAHRAVAQRERHLPLDQLHEAVRQAPPARELASLLPGTVAVIGEVKRVSATFADLTGLGDVAVMARFLAAGGAACVSVVTEPVRSRGSLTDLDAVRAAVDVPVMVSDVVVTPYQVHEARAHGADLLTLDARLDPLVLESLIERTASLGMTAVVEVRSRREALAALAAGAVAVAVDVRDPASGRIEPEVFAQVAELVPEEVLRVVGGGVASAHDVVEYARMGAQVVVVGEAAVRSTDPQQLMAQLVAAGTHPALPSAARGRAS